MNTVFALLFSGTLSGTFPTPEACEAAAHKAAIDQHAAIIHHTKVSKSLVKEGNEWHVDVNGKTVFIATCRKQETP